METIYRYNLIKNHLSIINQLLLFNLINYINSIILINIIESFYVTWLITKERKKNVQSLPIFKI